MILKLMAETKGHSHILGTILRRLRSDCQRKYLHRSVPWWRLLSSESALSVFLLPGDQRVRQGRVKEASPVGLGWSG